jgi:hypothetical protein
MGSLRGYKSPAITVLRLAVGYMDPSWKKTAFDVLSFSYLWKLLTDKQSLLEYQRR